MVSKSNLREPNRRDFIKFLGKGIAVIAAGKLLGFSSGCVMPEGISYERSRMAGEIHKVRPLAKRITEQSALAEEAVEAIVQWTEKNFFHFYDYLTAGERYGSDEVYGAKDLNDYIGNILLNLSIEEVFRERAVCCHLATFVMVTMLRSIEVAAEYRAIENNLRKPTGCHGALYVPSIGKYVHGDLVADLVGTPANQIIQTEQELKEMLLTERGYLSLEDELFEKYDLELHRSGEDLYIHGCFMKQATEQEINEVLNNLSEYKLRLGPEDQLGRKWVESERMPIKRLEDILI